jgi:hypothetical protein
MRPSKTALGLTVIAALTAPFVVGTSRPAANVQGWIPLSPQQRSEIVAKLDSSKNCRYFETQVEARDVLGLTVDARDIDDAMQCHREQDALRDGGEMRATFSLPRYLAINAAVAVASAVGALGLAMLFPALFRRGRWRFGN